MKSSASSYHARHKRSTACTGSRHIRHMRRGAVGARLVCCQGLKIFCGGAVVKGVAGGCAPRARPRPAREGFEAPASGAFSPAVEGRKGRPRPPPGRRSGRPGGPTTCMEASVSCFRHTGQLRRPPPRLSHVSEPGRAGRPNSGACDICDRFGMQWKFGAIRRPRRGAGVLARLRCRGRTPRPSV